MKIRRIMLGTTLLFFASAAVTSCSDDEDDPAGSQVDGAVLCDVLGSICHGPGEAEGGEYQDCHELGHEGDAAACEAGFDDCATLCLEAPAGGGSVSGPVLCEVLGSLCHGPGEELGGEYQDCHELGHEGEPEACAEEFDDCATLCLEASHGGEGGAGGAGGAGGEGGMPAAGGTAGAAGVAGAAGAAGAAGTAGAAGAAGASGAAGAPAE